MEELEVAEDNPDPCSPYPTIVVRLHNVYVTI